MVARHGNCTVLTQWLAQEAPDCWAGSASAAFPAEEPDSMAGHAPSAAAGWQSTQFPLITQALHRLQHPIIKHEPLI